MNTALVAPQKWKLWGFGIALTLIGACLFAAAQLAGWLDIQAMTITLAGVVGAFVLLLAASWAIRCSACDLSLVWYGMRHRKASEWLFWLWHVDACPRCEFSRSAGRLDKNAPGDFYTTGECLSCGAPEHEAPECLAALDDNNSSTYFVRQPETLEETENACRAAKVCCTNAIRYSGRDEKIMKRLGPAYCDHWVSQGLGKTRPDPHSLTSRS